MSDNPRTEELRRRVQKDPASIAFAQLAEEHRRAGEYEEAARVCRAGLHRHPTYLSARVTLGRALIELGQLEEAESELQYVLRSAPENLAAVRGLGEIHQRRGNLTEALRQFQTALALAKHDPELEESVHDLSQQLRTLDPQPAAATGVPPAEEPAAIPPGSLSPALEAAADEFTKALQALDALSLDLPASSVGDDHTAEEEEEEEEEEDAPDIDAPKAKLAGDEAVIHELESWLDSIVRAREQRAPKL